MGANVKFTDNSDIFRGAKDDAVRAALEAIGQQAEGYAKMKCPVDTGLLRNSITHMASGESVTMSYHAEYGSNRNSKGKRYKASSKKAGAVKIGSVSGAVGSQGVQVEYIGTGVEYAPYVEYGTSKTKAQPFLRPAATEHTSEYRAIVEEHLRNA